MREKRIPTPAEVVWSEIAQRKNEDEEAEKFYKSFRHINELSNLEKIDEIAKYIKKNPGWELTESATQFMEKLASINYSFDDPAIERELNYQIKMVRSAKMTDFEKEFIKK